MRKVNAKAVVGGHSAKCPECGSLTLVIGPPRDIKCGCGETYFATWWRVGDGIINMDAV